MSTKWFEIFDTGLKAITLQLNIVTNIFRYSRLIQLFFHVVSINSLKDFWLFVLSTNVHFIRIISSQPDFYHVSSCLPLWIPLVLKSSLASLSYMRSASSPHACINCCHFLDRRLRKNWGEKHLQRQFAKKCCLMWSEDDDDVMYEVVIMCDSCWMILMSIIRGGTACLQPPATSNATIYFTCITCSIHLNSLWQTCSMAVPFSTAPQEHGQGWLLQRTLTLLNACHVVVPTALGTVITHFQQFYLLHNPNRSHQILICDVEILGSNNDKGGQNAFLYHHWPSETTGNLWECTTEHFVATHCADIRSLQCPVVHDSKRWRFIQCLVRWKIWKHAHKLASCPTMIIGQWAVWRCFEGRCCAICTVRVFSALEYYRTLVRPARSLRS